MSESRRTLSRMRFLVDGYNITKGDPATRGLSLEQQRAALIARLDSRGPALLGRGDILVVFDGVSDSGRASAATPRGGHIEVRYSRDEKADEVIVRLARASREAVTLVTSDRELADRAHVHGGAEVRVLGREAVYESASARPAARRRGGASRDAGLPPGAHGITRELKELWLTGNEENDTDEE